MKAPSDTLMLTGVVRHCTDCDGDRIFVEPFSDDTGWAERQITTGRDVELIAPDGAVTTVQAQGVDTVTGALIVADPHAPDGERPVVVGEIRHVRMARVTPLGAAPARAGV